MNESDECNAAYLAGRITGWILLAQNAEVLAEIQRTRTLLEKTGMSNRETDAIKMILRHHLAPPDLTDPPRLEVIVRLIDEGFNSVDWTRVIWGLDMHSAPPDPAP